MVVPKHFRPAPPSDPIITLCTAFYLDTFVVILKVLSNTNIAEIVVVVICIKFYIEYIIIFRFLEVLL
jgi:hypothetical protein